MRVPMSTSPINLLLVGATGRMGQEICRAVQVPDRSRQFRIAGGIVASGSPDIGSKLPHGDGEIAAGWLPEFEGTDVIVDYSSDAGARLAARLAAEKKIPVLIASTGLTPETLAFVKAAAEVVPVVLTANTSIVVTALRILARSAAQLLGPDFDVEMVELHHRGKVDAPSGTALMILEEVAKAQGKDFVDVLDCGRHGRDALRKSGSLGAQALRGGDSAGEHTLYFLGDGERLELVQRATKRSVFADGALRASRWLHERGQRGAGLFTMEDVLQSGGGGALAAT